MTENIKLKHALDNYHVALPGFALDLGCFQITLSHHFVIQTLLASLSGEPFFGAKYTYFTAV